MWKLALDNRERVELCWLKILINGLAACAGVAFSPACQAPRVQILMYADDVVILGESAADLQRDLDAAHAWVALSRQHRPLRIRCHGFWTAVLPSSCGRVRLASPDQLQLRGRHVAPTVVLNSPCRQIFGTWWVQGACMHMVDKFSQQICPSALFSEFSPACFGQKFVSAGQKQTNGFKPSVCGGVGDS